MDKLLKNAERYYLTHLKGKSDKEILSNICSLKKQMNKIKRIIEDVTNGLMVIIVPFDTIRPSFSKKEFFNVLRLLHLDEWERKYTTECYGYNIDDGIEWFVEIDFYNGMKSRRFEGCNSFPYNFNMFLELIGIRHFFGFYVDFGKKD